MIHTLVQSAFQTGCLSVASEGLIRQVLSIGGYKAADLEVLEKLYSAVDAGVIKREAPGAVEMPLQRLRSVAQRR
ncbi:MULTISPECIES: hypothetical protein [Trichocoleus]|uniref:Uncharacterized protein n=1 Tax=Trichocoleus desertorum GB2-A4 TaxID=2933944 RepID=A0ABV0J8M4_9CYAN|nr:MULTISPECIES: hypothetical protein [unclassified Trichocoleus]MBD1860990.1 hypothetical protein [Trichocoleus sp. FACHB-46]MBD2094217.1 hypothetical protein [Trichocoleus sp. FACHB-591]MBD2122380.1 hypothetical protein [Trichocoleus sp. FACHB-262]